MAQIQYTSYKFTEPQIISEELYNKIKISRNNFNPFKFSFIKSYLFEFKIGILFYLIGAPIAFLLAETQIGFFEVIAGIWAFVAFFAFLSGILSTLSFFTFLLQKASYNRKLMRKVKYSVDYKDFVLKMSK